MRQVLLCALNCIAAILRNCGWRCLGWVDRASTNNQKTEFCTGNIIKQYQSMDSETRWMASPHCWWGQCSSEPGAPTAWGQQTALVWWCWDPEEPPCTAAHWGQRRRTLEVVRGTKTYTLTVMQFTFLVELGFQSFMFLLQLYTHVKRACVKLCSTDIH